MTEESKPAVDLKILSVREPWASLIIYGGKKKSGITVWKDVENRVWYPNPNMKGRRIAIHAAKSAQGLKRSLIDVEEIHGIVMDRDDLRFGAVLGSVELVKWVANSRSKWFGEPCGFVLKHPFAYPKPIPCDGQLNFFTRPEIKKTMTRYERLRLHGRR